MALRILSPDGGYIPPWFGGTVFVPPNPNNFTWVNQGGNSVVSSLGQLVMKSPGSGGPQWRFLKQPYSGIKRATLAFNQFCMPAAGDSAMGIVVYDSTSGKMIDLSLDCAGNSIGLRSYQWTSPTVVGALQTNRSALSMIASPMMLSIKDDGVNLSLDISTDGGQSYQSLFSAGRTAWMPNPDSFGFGIMDNSGTPSQMNAIHWAVK